MERIRARATAAVCAAVALAAATAAPAHPAEPARTATVTIRDFAYHPGTLRVHRGSTVTVVNRDSTNHSFTSVSGRFDLSRLGPGRRGRVRFSHAGTFHYFCAFHDFMRGTVVVR